MDITMCSGKNCPLKDLCYRFTAPKSEFMQSFFLEPPIKDGKCDMYWGDLSEAIWGQLKDIVKPK